MMNLHTVFRELAVTLREIESADFAEIAPDSERMGSELPAAFAHGEQHRFLICLKVRRGILPLLNPPGVLHQHLFEEFHSLRGRLTPRPHLHRKVTLREFHRLRILESQTPFQSFQRNDQEGAVHTLALGPVLAAPLDANGTENVQFLTIYRPNEHAITWA